MMNATADHPVMEFSWDYLPCFLASATFFFSLMTFGSPTLSAKYVPMYNRLKPIDKADWNTRMVSNLHAVIVSILSVYLMLTDEATLSDKLWGTSHLARVNVCIICGYLMADLVYMLMLFPLSDSWIFIIHHVFVLLPFGFNIVYGILTYFANFRITTECSTLFVNTRWFLTILDLKTSKLYIANGLMMTAVFFMCRIVSIPLYYATVYQDVSRVAAVLPRSFIVIWLSGGMVMDVLNVFWFRKIVRGATKTLMMGMTKPGGATIRNRVKGE